MMGLGDAFQAATGHTDVFDRVAAMFDGLAARVEATDESLFDKALAEAQGDKTNKRYILEHIGCIKRQLREMDKFYVETMAWVD